MCNHPSHNILALLGAKYITLLFTGKDSHHSFCLSHILMLNIALVSAKSVFLFSLCISVMSFKWKWHVRAVQEPLPAFWTKKVNTPGAHFRVVIILIVSCERAHIWAAHKQGSCENVLAKELSLQGASSPHSLLWSSQLSCTLPKGGPACTV